MPDSPEAAPLWTAEAAAAATGGRAQGAWRAGSVAIDSREMDRGALFVALAGEARDGHVFVKGALEAGAATAMVSAPPADLPADAPLLVVEDTLRGLERLGAAARARAAALTAIAVTGSVGKTTAKSMLAAILSDQGPTHAAERSFNNHWGVPLTLARMPAGARYGVFEVGMNHPGEITPLTRLVRPHAALITTVAPVHMEAFASVEEVAEAKAEIFLGLEPGGAAVIHRDIDQHALLAARAREAGAGRILSFGARGEAARLVSARVAGEATEIEAELLGRPLRLRLGAPGRHMAMNALAALLTAETVGADPERAASSLERWRPASGRGERFRRAASGGGAFLLIDESYNANPTSMAAAFEVLAAAEPEAGGRRVAFVSDMLELGPEAEALHAGLARLDAVLAADRVHASGPLSQALLRALPETKRGEWFEDPAVMAEAAPGLIRAGDAVMVKGSKGSRASLTAKRLRDLDPAG